MSVRSGPSRRAVSRSLAAGFVGVTLTACTRRTGRGQQSASPSPDAPTKDPGVPLVVGTVGGGYGLEAQFEKQIALGISEARIDVDNVGGVFGRPVELVERYVVTDPADDLAGYVTTLADRGASAAIVSCDEDVLARAMPHFADAGIAVVSVTSTAMGIRADAAATRGLLFRLTVSDRGLARTFGQEALATTGDQGLVPRSVAYVSRDSTQGRSLEQELRDVVAPNYGSLVGPFFFAPDAPALDTAALLAAKPSLIVVNGGAQESVAILRSLHDGNLGPDGRPVLRIPVRLGYYNSGAYGDQLPPEALAQVTGTRAGVVPSAEHVDMMLAADTSLGLGGFDFSEEAYDALVVLALSAQSAATVEGTQVAQFIPAVLDGGDEASTVEDALVALRDGGDIHYVGRSGTILLQDGDPVTAQVSSVTYADNNQVQDVQSSGVDLRG